MKLETANRYASLGLVFAFGFLLGVGSCILLDSFPRPGHHHPHYSKKYHGQYDKFLEGGKQL